MTDGIAIPGVDGQFDETGVILVDSETKWSIVIPPKEAEFDPRTYHYDEATKQIILDGQPSGTKKSFVHLASTVHLTPVVTMAGLEELVKTTLLGNALKGKLKAKTAKMARKRTVTVQCYSKVKAKSDVALAMVAQAGGTDEDMAVNPDGSEF